MLLKSEMFVIVCLTLKILNSFQILLKTANFNSGTISVLDFYDFIIDILHVFDPNYNFVEDEVFYNDGEGAQFLITHNDYELMIKRVL